MAKQIRFDIKLNVDGKEVVGSAVSDVKEMRKAWDDARSSLKKFADESFTLNQITESIQNITSAFNSLTEESRSFSVAMKAANTMAGKSGVEFEELTDKVKDLAKVIPLTRDELAKGLYQVISNGVPEDNWISYLEASSRAAVGGIANLEEVVKVTSTVIKNYGLDWSDAMKIQDQIQLTAKNGVTSFEQLAAALPAVVGQAAQLGVSFEEVSAVMATLTGVTGNTSEVSTQLASVLTALTKESEKSQTAAEEMGITFNAASIKAAGGLKNFLQELDKTVTAYAEKTGQLRESIYSKLFGRAEALRLVNGLTGELAEKFEQNIQVMDNSAGTINAAFEEMASTGSSATQMMMNQIAEFTDILQDKFGAVLPLLNITSQIGMSILALRQLGAAAVFLSRSLGLTSLATAAYSAALSGLRTVALWVAFSMTKLEFALKAVTASMGIVGVLILLYEALMSVFSASENATEATDEFSKAQKDAAEHVTSANEAMENAATSTTSKMLTSYEQLRTAWLNLSDEQSKTQWIEENKSKFEELGLSVTDVTSAEDIFVNRTHQMKEAFLARGKAAGIAAKMAKNYERIIELELQQEKHAADERQHRMDNSRIYKEGEAVDARDKGNEKVAQQDQYGIWRYTGEGAASRTAEAYRRERMTTRFDLPIIRQLEQEKIRLEKENEHLAQEADNLVNDKYYNMVNPSTSSAKALTQTQVSGAGGKKDKKKDEKKDKKKDEKKDKKKEKADKPDMTGKYYQNPTTRDELSHNIDVASAKAQSAKTDAELNGLREKINSWQNKIDQMDLQELSAQRPNISELNSERPGVSGYQSLDEVRREMAYWQKFLEVAKTEGQRDTARANLKGLEEVQRSMMKTLPKYTNTLAEIAEAEQYWNEVRENGDEITIKMADNALEELGKKKRILENTSIAAFDSADIKTYDELTRKLQYYEEELQHATSGAARKQIQDHIDDLNKVKDAWDEQLVVVEKDITKLRTVKDLSEDISKIQQKQQKLTNADEWEEYARMIDARSKKQKGLERGQVIIDNENELSELFKLSGKELRLEVKAMGIDGINSKIRELQKMLDDTDNPLTEKQNSEVKRLIEQYEDLRKVCVQSFDTYREGWSAVQNVGDGIQSMTDALEGHKSAWERITGTVNAALQIYDGIMKIVEFINLLTSVTKAQTAAEAAKTVATTASTTAQGIEAAAEETNAAASVPAIVANKALAASFTEVASAAYFAAHASIPFAGFGIAAGFSTTAAAMVQAIGMMTFAQGGIVGGSSIAGDNLLARVNSGEMILNTLQQRRLFNLLDGKTPYSALSPTGSRAVPTPSLSALRHNLNNGGNISLEVQGRKLVGVLANETRISGKSGRRTNIRI